MNKWKTIAIIFIILFTLETAIWIWAISSAISEENKILECSYEICGDYASGWYESGLCTCYDYDVLGELIPVEYEVMQ